MKEILRFFLILVVCTLLSGCESDEDPNFTKTEGEETAFTEWAGKLIKRYGTDDWYLSVHFKEGKPFWVGDCDYREYKIVNWSDDFKAYENGCLVDGIVKETGYDSTGSGVAIYYDLRITNITHCDLSELKKGNEE